MLLRCAVALLICCQFLWQCVPALAAFDQTHSALTTELKKFVDTSGVHYAKWKNQQQGLNAYIASLEKITPEEYATFTPDQKKALWINTYNALAIKVVLDHYPIHGDKTYYPPNSLRQISGCFEEIKVKIAGRQLDLWKIAHNLIRKECADPRMHFAVVCAAKGCPKLRDTAYVAENLDSDLEKAASDYVNNPRNVQIDPAKNELRVSLLFSWFPLDFAMHAFKKVSFPPPDDNEIIAAYISKWLPAKQRDLLTSHDWKLVYLPYDWALNDADGQVAKTSYSSLPSIMLQSGHDEVGCQCLPQAYANYGRGIGELVTKGKSGVVVEVAN
jgi:hypothetical protein